MEVESESREKETTSAFAILFKNSSPRKLNKNSRWGNELDNYKKEDRAHMDSDPLLWWKLNEYKYPGLGILFFH